MQVQTRVESAWFQRLKQHIISCTGAQAKAWCLLTHAEASLSLTLSLSLVIFLSHTHDELVSSFALFYLTSAPT
jgi:hypothetical protein